MKGNRPTKGRQNHMDKETTEMIRDKENLTPEPQQEETTGPQSNLIAQVLTFLIKECRQNNPDSARECDALTAAIVEEFGTVDTQIIPPAPATAAPAAAAPTPIIPKPSRRFRR